MAQITMNDFAMNVILFWAQVRGVACPSLAVLTTLAFFYVLYAMLRSGGRLDDAAEKRTGRRMS